ncbi:MAG: M48 family metallopeptidase [Candidatus Methylacidiphilales bacterium]
MKKRWVPGELVLHQGMRIKPIFLAGIALFLLVVACATIHETGEKRFFLTSPQLEKQMGLTAFQDIKTSQKVSTNTAAIAQVNRVAQRIIPVVNVPGAEWEVVVFEDSAPNAFALPGGKIGIHTGLLPITQSDAGLAAVMGHEIAHVSLRHGGQRVSRQLAISGGMQLLDAGLALNSENYPRYRTQIMTGLGIGTQIGMILPFSRDNEYEADRIGMKYMAQAGYDPAEAVEVWKRMKALSDRSGGKPPEWLSTHPADASRIQALADYLPTARQFMRN